MIDRVTLGGRLADLCAEHKVPGAVFALEHSGDITEVAAGVLNKNTGVEATADSLFQIGSITKPYTATLVMQLVDEGKVDLDAPVITYLPEFRLSDKAISDRITIRHLLTHTSGIGGDFFADTGRGDDCLERLVEVCADLAPEFEPGETMSYCNTGYSILGRVTEKLTNGVWDKVLKERLFEPLGLRKSATLPEEALLHRVAVGHQGSPGEDQNVVARWVMSRGGGPAGRICSTVGDLLVFARMHLDDGRASDGTQVLSQASVKAMREPQVDIPDRHSLGDAWGLGWILYTWGGSDLFGHDGATVGQNARLKILPDRNIALALVTNGGNSLQLYRALYGEVLREIAGVEMPAALALPASPPTLDLELYAGRYERLNVRMDLLAKDGRLAGTLSYSGSLLQIVPKPVIDIEAKPVDATAFLFSTPETPDASPMAFYDFDDNGRPGFMHAGGRAMRHAV